MNFKSSVLQCYADDDGCPCCEFLSGKQDEDTLLAVIKTLDTKLAESEQAERILRSTISALTSK